MKLTFGPQAQINHKLYFIVLLRRKMDVGPQVPCSKSPMFLDYENEFIIRDSTYLKSN